MLMIRRLAASLLAVMLVAFAPAAFGLQPDKIFTLSMSSVSLSGVLTATMTNASPNGNSSINSATLTLSSSSTGAWRIGTAASSTGTVTVASDGLSLQVTNMSPVKPTKSFVVTIQLAPGTVACGSSGTWTAVPYTGSTLSGDTFSFASIQDPAKLTSTSSCDGTLACGASFPAGTHVTGATRLPSNKDGSACVLVNYDFNDNVDTLNSTLLQWDASTQPGAAFQYTVNWQPVLYGSLTPPPVGQTKVAWYVNGVLTTPAPAQACLSTSPPTAYGTLTASIPDGAVTTIYIGASPPPVNTPITVDRERMVVTGGSAGAWTVQRGAGGTTATAHSQYYADNSTPKAVMSNPLPLDPVTHNQMQMCLIDEGWMTVDASKCVTPPSPISSSTACVQKSSTVFDLGDGYMIGN